MARLGREVEGGLFLGGRLRLARAAGAFVPTPFLDYDGPAYDSYFELDRTIFFITQTVVRGMVDAGRGGSIVSII